MRSWRVQFEWYWNSPDHRECRGPYGQQTGSESVGILYAEHAIGTRHRYGHTVSGHFQYTERLYLISKSTMRLSVSRSDRHPELAARPLRRHGRFSTPG